LQGADLAYVKQNLSLVLTTLGWKSISNFKGNTLNDRTTNLIVSGRFLNVNYLESPRAEYDPIDFYSGNNWFCLE
jgi:hypothetical protein